MADSKAETTDGSSDSLHGGLKSRHGRRAQAEMIKFVLQANNGYGISVSDACDGKNDAPVNVSRTTLTRWLDLFHTFGELPFDLYRRKGWRQGITRLLIRVELATLKELVDSNPRQRIGELRLMMKVRTGIKFTYHVIWRGVREKPPNGLGYNRKKLAAMARQADALDEDLYLQALATYPDPKVFLFIDETGVNEKETQRKNGYGLPGQDLVVWDVFEERGGGRSAERRYTATLAMNINGFHPRLLFRYHKEGDEDDDPDHGTMTGETCADYFEHGW